MTQPVGFGSAPPYPLNFAATVTPAGATNPTVRYYITDYYSGSPTELGSSTASPGFAFALSQAQAQARLGTCVFVSGTLSAKVENCGNPLIASGNSVGGFIDTGGFCPITSSRDRGPVTWSNELQVPGAQGQAVLNGRDATFPRQGRSFARGRIEAGENRLELHLVAASGRPGTWRVELPADAVRSLRVVTGDAVEIGEASVLLRFSGRPGERALIVFSGR
jgi:hypothetical protein